MAKTVSKMGDCQKSYRNVHNNEALAIFLSHLRMTLYFEISAFRILMTNYLDFVRV